MVSKLTTQANVTDKRMRQWSIAVQVDKVLGRRVAYFRVWPFKRVNLGSRPVGMTCCAVDESGDAKVEDFRVDPKYQNRGIGSKLLAEMEKWAVNAGVRRLWGDLVKADSDHFPMLRYLYTKHGWTWCLFSTGDSRLRRDSHIVGMVEKIISPEKLQA